MPPHLPRALYPVLKGLLLGADGSVWSVVEDPPGERVERLRPESATLAADAGPLQIASYEVLLLSRN